MRFREPCKGVSTVRMHSRMDLRGQTETAVCVRAQSMTERSLTDWIPE